MKIVFLAAIMGYQAPGGARPSNADPAAIQALDAMVKAYRSVSKLHQETTYSAGEGKVAPLLRSRLVLSRPNRIVLDMMQPGVDRQQPYRLLYQCDGKDLYAYQETKGFYAKEKAPKSLKELDYLSVSIEMAAITGGDPAAQFIAQAKAVRLGGSDLIDSVPSDIVIFDMGSPERNVELRLAIGKKDHLLRRFDFSSIPVPKPEPEKPKDVVIVGDPNAPPPPEKRPEEPVRFVYENHVFLDRDLPKDVFKWVAPPGSFAYQEYPSLLNPRGGTSAAVAGAITMYGQKPMKIIPYDKMMKDAWKKQKK